MEIGKEPLMAEQELVQIKEEVLSDHEEEVTLDPSVIFEGVFLYSTITQYINQGQGQQKSTHVDLHHKDLRKRALRSKEWQQLILGPYCWKCFTGNTYYTCEACTRSYHLQCAEFGGYYPSPIFHKEVTEKTRQGQKKMLRCPECLVLEETRIESLKNFPVEKLNKMLSFFMGYVITDLQFKDMLEEALEGVKLRMTLDMILEKASMKLYRTLEEFCGDLKWIKFYFRKIFGETDEAIEVVDTLFGIVKQELDMMEVCPECYWKIWTPEGKLRCAVEYSQEMQSTCQEPHLPVWVKYDGYPQWPSKLLALREGKATVYAFKDKCPTVVDVKQVFLFYPYKNSKAGKSWRVAMTDFKRYVENAEKKFGKMNLPRALEPVAGSLRQLKERIYSSHFKQGSRGNRN